MSVLNPRWGAIVAKHTVAENVDLLRNIKVIDESVVL